MSSAQRSKALCQLHGTGTNLTKGLSLLLLLQGLQDRAATAATGAGAALRAIRAHQEMLSCSSSRVGITQNPLQDLHKEGKQLKMSRDSVHELRSLCRGGWMV